MYHILGFTTCKHDHTKYHIEMQIAIVEAFVLSEIFWYSCLLHSVQVDTELDRRICHDGIR